MKKTNYLLILLLSGVVFASSCKKGDVGPAGAKGTTGAAGAAGSAGSAGATGATGATGSANVIYSDWNRYAPANGSILFQTLSGGGLPTDATTWLANIPASEVTAGIIDSGLVLMYIKVTKNQYGSVYAGTTELSTAYQLPISLNYTDGFLKQSHSTWNYNVRSGNEGFIELFYTNNISTNYPDIYTQFRYVIIPGGVHTLGSVNPKNYQQVAQALHIPN